MSGSQQMLRLESLASVGSDWADWRFLSQEAHRAGASLLVG